MSVVAVASKRVIFAAKQSDYGTIAAANAADAFTVRRKSTTVRPSKKTFESQEKRPSMQSADFGHGLKTVEGDINMELYPNAFTPFWAAICRRDFTHGTDSTAGSTDTFTLVASTGVLTRSGAGSFIADGRFVGEILRSTAGDAALDGRNLRVIAVTSATSITVSAIDRKPLVDITGDQNMTLTSPGKYTYIPTSGHTEDAFTLADESIDKDIGSVLQDCRVTKVDVSMQPGNYVDVTFHFIGSGVWQDYEGASAPYFTTPAGPSLKRGLTGVKAAIRINGAYVPISQNGLKFSIDLMGEAIETAGQDTSEDVVYGRVAMVSGEFAVYLKNNNLRALFANETEVPIEIAWYAPGTANNDLVSCYFPRCKINDNNRDDPEKAIQENQPFRSLEPDPAVGKIASSFIFQDTSIPTV